MNISRSPSPIPESILDPLPSSPENLIGNREIEIDEKAHALSSITPKKYYPLMVKNGGKIEIQLTPGIKKHKGNVIYKWKYQNKSLIGQTSNFENRMRTGYQYAFNHPEKEIVCRKLVDDVQKAPQEAAVGILYKNEDPRISNEEIEAAFIAAKNATYNKRRTVHRPIRKVAETTRKVSSIRELPTYLSPEKWYPIHQDEQGKTSVEWSPEGKKTERCIYVFKDDMDRRYIGKTTQELSKRVAVHLCNAKKNSSKKEFYQVLKHAPETMKCGIAYKADQNENLDLIEAKFIQDTKSVEQGFNSNKGPGYKQLLAMHMDIVKQYDE